MKNNMTKVLATIEATRLSLKLLKAIDYGDDDKACALHNTVMSALDDIETAYREEKENEYKTNSERI